MKPSASLAAAAVASWLAGAARAADVPDTAALRANFAPSFVLVMAGRSPGQSLQRGSGVVISAGSPPIVATAFHVIEGMTSAEVVLGSGVSLPIVAAAVDANSDLALLAGPAGRWLVQDIPWKRPDTVASQPLALAGYRTEVLDVVPCTLSVLPVRFAALLHRGGLTPPVDFDALSIASGDVFSGDSGGPFVDARGNLVGLALGTLVLPDRDGGGQHFGVPTTVALPTNYKPLTAWLGTHDPYGALTAVAPHRAYVRPAITFGSPLGALGASTSDVCAAPLVEVAEGKQKPADAPASCRERAAKVAEVGDQEYETWVALQKTLRLRDDAQRIEDQSQRHFSALFAEGAKTLATSKDPKSLSALCVKIADANGADKSSCVKVARLKLPAQADRPWYAIGAFEPSGRDAVKALVDQTDVMGETALARTFKLTTQPDQLLFPEVTAKSVCKSCPKSNVRMSADIAVDSKRADASIEGAIGKVDRNSGAMVTDDVVKFIIERSAQEPDRRSSRKLDEAAQDRERNLLRLSSLKRSLITGR